MKLPRYVLICANTVVEQKFHGNSMIPHWTNIREEGESRVSTTSGETHEIKVSYVPGASFYYIIERREYGDIVRAVSSYSDIRRARIVYPFRYDCVGSIPVAGDGECLHIRAIHDVTFD